MSVHMSPMILLAGLSIGLGLPGTSFAQQRTMLDEAATMIATASINPEGLVQAGIMDHATPGDRDVYRRDVAPCFRRIGDTFRARQPDLRRQCDIVSRNMPHGNGAGTAACQAATDADGYVRATVIAELAITDPTRLPQSSEFQFNNNIHTALLQKLSLLPLPVRQASAAQIEQQMQSQVGAYKSMITQICLQK